MNSRFVAAGFGRIENIVEFATSAAVIEPVLADTEYATETSGHGRTLFEWQRKPNRDNHFLDALILAGVGAAMSGATSVAESIASRRRSRRNATPINPADGSEAKDRKPKLSLVEMREAARAKRGFS